jgi:DNA end-binding protein Ku
MAARPIWRGHLRLALVSCPVALYTAKHERGNLHFHLINPKTGHRVRMVTLDAETGEEVKRSDLVRGYEFKKDHYILLDDEDFEKARVESSSTITVDKFVDASSIDPIYYDASYFLVPEGETGEDVYAVLREAVAKSGKVALSRVVISRRERAIAIMPMQRGMVVHTLHEEGDINNPKELFENIPSAKPDPEMVKLALQLIERQAGRYDPADMEDRYEARLRAVIEAKLKGEGIEPVEEAEPERGNVIDLMAALKKSLGQERDASAGKKANAKPGTKASHGKAAQARERRPAKPATRSAARKPIQKRA